MRARASLFLWHAVKQRTLPRVANECETSNALCHVWPMSVSLVSTFFGGALLHPPLSCTNRLVQARKHTAQ